MTDGEDEPMTDRDVGELFERAIADATVHACRKGATAEQIWVALSAALKEQAFNADDVDPRAGELREGTGVVLAGALLVGVSACVALSVLMLWPRV
jgi:hypothetical protein